MAGWLYLLPLPPATVTPVPVSLSLSALITGRIYLDAGKRLSASDSRRVSDCVATQQTERFRAAEFRVRDTAKNN